MPLKAGSQWTPLGQISVKWNEVKEKWREKSDEMNWKKKSREAKVYTGPGATVIHTLNH